MISGDNKIRIQRAYKLSGSNAVAGDIMSGFYTMYIKEGFQVHQVELSVHSIANETYWYIRESGSFHVPTSLKPCTHAAIDQLLDRIEALNAEQNKGTLEANLPVDI